MSTETGDYDKEKLLSQGGLNNTGRVIRNKSSTKRHLWTNSWSSKRLSSQLAIVVTCVGMFLGLAGPWILGYIQAPIAKKFATQERMWGYVFIGSLIFGVISGCYACYIGYAWRAIWRRSRPPLLLDSFINRSGKLSRIDLNWVRSIREKLGDAYHIKPELIYPEDTPRLLRRLCEGKDPYGFEVILECAHQIGSELTDFQVEQITQKLHRQAQNVEDLIEIIALSLAATEKDPPLIETLTRFRSKECQQLLMNESLKTLSGRQRHFLRRYIKSKNFDEPRLWPDVCYSRNFSQYIVLGLVFLVLSFLFNLMVIQRYHLPFRNNSILQTLFLITFGYLWFCLISSLYRLRFKYSRKPLSLELFLRSSNELNGVDMEWIETIRERLGLAYQISPESIYPEDTPSSLQKLQSSQPLGFEIVLGSAKQLGFNLSDEQVDLIIQRIHKEAHNVAETIKIIAQEFHTNQSPSQGTYSG